MNARPSRRSVLSALAVCCLATACSGSAGTGSGPAGANAAPARADGGPQVILIRGLANIFSTGLDTLAGELNKAGIPARSTSLGDPQARARAISTAYAASRRNRPVILVGHSYGADEAIRIAGALDTLGVPVALLITFDPTIKGPVTRNVRRALNFHTADDGIWSPITAVPGYKGTLVNRNVKNGKNAVGDVNHFNVEKSGALHAVAVREIKAALRRR